MIVYFRVSTTLGTILEVLTSLVKYPMKTNPYLPDNAYQCYKMKESECLSGYLNTIV